MIGRLVGTVIHKKAPDLLIDCGGIGYEVQATMSVFANLPNTNEESVIIHTHLSIRDDAHVLFGFHSMEERNVFRTLIKVNGIGPKLGVLILSGMTLQQLAQSIQNKDSSALIKLPGIGKKTADRLVMELTDKLKIEQIDGNANSAQTSPLSSGKSDAIEALSSLGYKTTEAEKMVNIVYSDDIDSETLIRLALQAKLK